MAEITIGTIIKSPSTEFVVTKILKHKIRARVVNKRSVKKGLVSLQLGDYVEILKKDITRPIKSK